MKQEHLTYEQEQNLIARAIGVPSSSLKDKGIITNYSQGLERALVKALCKNTEMRRELRRLNQSVRHINALEAQVAAQNDEINCLIELLDREDEEDRADTDPAELQVCCPHDLNIVKPEDNFPVNNVPSPTMEQAYNEWDMRTRYPNLIPRDYIGRTG